MVIYRKVKNNQSGAIWLRGLDTAQKSLIKNEIKSPSMFSGKV